MKPSMLAVLVAAPLISGCASWSNWYSQTPVGIRHTRMMVDSEQEYAYYVDPVQQRATAYQETPWDRLSRLFTSSR
jgi:hypothetical protein